LVRNNNLITNTHYLVERFILKIVNNKKNVIILIISLFTLLIFLVIGVIFEYSSYLNQKHIEYETIFTKTTLDILQQAILCKEMSQLTSQTWYNNIYNISYTNLDFNTSLPNLHNAFQNGNTLKNRESNKSDIEKEMIKLQNPPKDYVIAYNLFIKLYSKYEQIYLQATKPRGLFSNYNNSINEKSNEFYLIYDKMIILKCKLNNSVLIYNPVYIS